MPAGWKRVDGKGTVYSLVNDDSGLCLHAVSNHGNMSIGKKLSVAVEDYQTASWRWKVVRFPDGGREDIKKKNDSPAGIYIMLKDGFFFKSLKYVWSDTLPAGTMVPSKYNSNVKIIVLESGTAHQGQWVPEKVNLKEDIARYIGKNLTQIIGVGILTDADNTSSLAEAYYADFMLLPK